MPPPPLQQFPAPAPEQPDKSPYDFFMENQNNQKKSPFSGGGISGKMWLLIGSGAVVLLMILGVLGFALFGNKGDTAPELAVAQSQQEIIRIATDGIKNAKSDNLKNFSITASMSVTSAQQEYLAILAKHGIKVGPKELALGHKAKTDQALAAALNVNTYDTTFSTIMKSELDDYEVKLNEVASKVTNKADQATLQKQNAGAQLLRVQLLAQ